MRLGARTPTLILPCVLWVAGIAFGLYELAVFSNTSGDPGAPAAQWPVGATAKLAPDRPTLVLALHPQCACSRATLEELGRLLARAPRPLRVEVLAFQPDAAEDWSETGLVPQAQSMPGVAVRLDRNGAEAKRFGMTVSGHAMLYSAKGELLFSGGITRARGHAGDNAGRSAILSLLGNGPPGVARTRVFGCSILDRR